MKVVLYEPEAAARAALNEQLSTAGCSVAPFSDARTAFLFLLARLHEVDGILVNVDDPKRSRWLIERLDLVRQPLAVVTYSEFDGGGGAEIQSRLLGDRAPPSPPTPGSLS